MFDSYLPGVRGVAEQWNGESEFQGMKMELEGFCCLNMILISGGYSKVIRISAEFDMCSQGLWHIVDK